MIPHSATFLHADSVVRVFTATLVRQVMAEHRVGLDEPIAGFLPGLGLDGRLTARILLRHTGLPGVDVTSGQ